MTISINVQKVSQNNAQYYVKHRMGRHLQLPKILVYLCKRFYILFLRAAKKKWFDAALSRAS